MGWTLPPPGPHDARSVSDFNEHKRKKITFAEKQAAFPGGSVDKKSACNAGHTGELSLIPGSRRAPGRGHVHPLWCLGLQGDPTSPSQRRSALGFLSLFCFF